MRFYDAYEYEIDTNLCETEQRLKDLYFENQDRHLEKPHDIKDCRDIFVKASQTDDCLFPKFLVDNLEEDLFFHKNMQSPFQITLYSLKEGRKIPPSYHISSLIVLHIIVQLIRYHYTRQHNKWNQDSF